MFLVQLMKIDIVEFIDMLFRYFNCETFNPNINLYDFGIYNNTLFIYGFYEIHEK